MYKLSITHRLNMNSNDYKSHDFLISHVERSEIDIEDLAIGRVYGDGAVDNIAHRSSYHPDIASAFRAASHSVPYPLTLVDKMGDLRVLPSKNANSYFADYRDGVVEFLIVEADEETPGREYLKKIAKKFDTMGLS